MQWLQLDWRRCHHRGAPDNNQLLFGSQQYLDLFRSTDGGLTGTALWHGTHQPERRALWQQFHSASSPRSRWIE
jgi:hypothetical protein